MTLVNCRRVSSVDLFFLKTRCVFSSAFSKKNLAHIRNHRMHICILRDPSHVFKLQTRIWCKAWESMKPLTSAGKLAICAKCRKTFNCSPFFMFYYFINFLSAWLARALCTFLFRKSKRTPLLWDSGCWNLPNTFPIGIHIIVFF